MKVILIQTPIILPINHSSSHRAVPPLSLAYLNAFLINQGHDSKIIDAPGEAIDQYTKIPDTEVMINGLTSKQIIQRIPAETQFIGVSCQHSNEWFHDLLLIKNIRKSFPQSIIILGGEHASATAYKIMSNHSEVDYIVCGEGELPLLKIIESHTHTAQLPFIPGVAQRRNNQIIQNPKGQRLSDLSIIPKPNWNGVPLDEYFKRRLAISSFNKKTMPIIASRGCPFSCSFCTCNLMWGSTWKSRPVGQVISEILEYKNKYNIENIDFIDMTVIIDKVWAQEFCKKMLEEKTGVTFSIPIGTHPKALSPELLGDLKKAGLEKIVFSTETGSSLTLEKINKDLDLAKIEHLIKTSIKLNISTKLVLIFGFPDQGFLEVLQSYLYLLRFAIWGGQDVVCLSFVPYPGTVFFEQLQKEPSFEQNYSPALLNNDFKTMKSWSKKIPSKSMKWITVLGMSLFYGFQFALRPWRFFVLIYRIFITQKPFTALETILFARLKRAKIKILQSEEKYQSDIS